MIWMRSLTFMGATVRILLRELRESGLQIQLPRVLEEYDRRPLEGTSSQHIC